MARYNPKDTEPKWRAAWANANTFLTPGSGAVVGNIQRAIDLQASTLSNVTINNSGQILGDLLFGSTGNNHVLNVGNIAGAANPASAGSSPMRSLRAAMTRLARSAATVALRWRFATR